MADLFTEPYYGECPPDSESADDEAICFSSRSVSHDVSENKKQKETNSMRRKNRFHGNRVPASRSRIPNCPIEGPKLPQAMANSCHTSDEQGDDSVISNVDLHSRLYCNCSVNRERPSSGAFDRHGGSCNSTIDYLTESRKNSTAGCDAAKIKEDASSNFLHTHLLAWFAGLIIRAFYSQWSFLFHIILSMILAWYHSLMFALHPLTFILHARAKATKMYRKKKYGIEEQEALSQKKAVIVRTTLVTGARKLAFGILAALYTLSLLSGLFLASLMVGFHTVNCFVEDPVQTYEYLLFDYTNQLPLASMDFANSFTYPRSGALLKRLSYPSRSFRATIYLTVPESDFNKELGIFQVTAELVSGTGQVLVSKTQPCMLRYRSAVSQNIKAFLNVIPLLAGYYLETQTLVVSSFTWHDQRAFSSPALRVVMAPRAGRPLLMGVPELYEAGVAVESELPWVLRVVGNLRWTLSVWLGLMLFMGLLTILLSLCNQVVLPDFGHLLSMISKGSRKGESCNVKATCCSKPQRRTSDPGTQFTNDAESVNQDRR